MISSFLGAFWRFLERLTSSALTFLGNLLSSLINGLITVLKLLFSPIFMLIALVFYFVYKVAELFVLLLAVLLAIGKLLYSFCVGLFKTIAGLSWTPTTPNHGAWSAPIKETFNAMSYYQLDKVAYVLMFMVWIFTAYSAIKILTGGGGGGSD